MTECPCGSGKAYAQCCQRYHSGEAAPSAEALMRSRYTAFVLELEPYLLATWHADTRPDKLDMQASPKPRWLGLQVKRHVQDGEHGTVEFVARYRIGGRAHRLHEISRFVCEDGRWYYVDGSFVE